MIVGRKKICDILNACLIEHHASRLEEDIQLYHSKDSIMWMIGNVAGDLQDTLW